MSKLILLPDWECSPSVEYVVAALGGEEKLRKDAFKDVCAYFGLTH